MLRDASEHLRHSLEDHRPQLLVSHAVVLRMRERTAHRAKLKPYLPDQEKTIPGDPVNGLVGIQLTKLGLVIEGDVDRTVEDPRAALEIGVQANVYSSREGMLAHRAMGRWEYSGTAHRLSELTAENARLLNEEIEAAAKLLARRIVN